MSENESEKRETSDDIADEIRRAVESMGDEMPYTVSAGTMRRVANRLEAALKRERAAFDCECAEIAELAAKEEAARHKPGNVTAMREALEFVEHMNDSPYTTYDVLVAIQKARAALSAPPRQCDVGTPEEQATRLDRHCENTTCNKCPARLVPHRKGEYDDRCILKWGQTPYAAEEGAGK